MCLLLSAMTTSYATSYDQTTTVTEHSTTQTVSSGVVDKIYIRSIPGILKVVEMVWYTFICSVLTCNFTLLIYVIMYIL